MQRPKQSKDRLAHAFMQQPCVGKKNGPRTVLIHERVNNHFSTDARQLFAEQHIDNPGAADTGFHQYHSLVIADDFADDLSVVRAGVRASSGGLQSQGPRCSRPPTAFFTKHEQVFFRDNFFQNLKLQKGTRTKTSRPGTQDRHP